MATEIENVNTEGCMTLDELHTYVRETTGRRISKKVITKFLTENRYIQWETRNRRSRLYPYLKEDINSGGMFFTVDRESKTKGIPDTVLYITERGASELVPKILDSCTKIKGDFETVKAVAQREYAERMGGETLLKWQLGEDIFNGV
jgi:hypothetical protein